MSSFVKDLAGVEEIQDSKESKINAVEAHQLMMARNITKEILDFGVTQNQIFQIMGLLALELENREVMLHLVDVIKQAQEDHRQFRLSK